MIAILDEEEEEAIRGVLWPTLTLVWLRPDGLMNIEMH